MKTTVQNTFLCIFVYVKMFYVSKNSGALSFSTGADIMSYFHFDMDLWQIQETARGEEKQAHSISLICSLFWMCQWLRIWSTNSY